MKIDIHYIARVEGEGSVKFEIKNGKLRNLKLNIWEPPRFFEGFLVGRKYDEVPDIVSRICGICPVSHMTTSIYAIEKAMGFTPSEEIKKIRTIMALSQILASHIIHIYMLALPDYHGLEVLSGLGNEIGRLIKLKEAVNNVTAVFGGRPLHPVSMIVGGFTKIPSRDQVGKMIKQLEAVKKDALDTVKMVSELRHPELRNESDYMAVLMDGEYALNEGFIATASGLNVETNDYYSYFEEREVPYANTKRTILKGRGPVMVGALSRLNIKYDLLHPEAKKAAQMIEFKPGERNPFRNIIAQAVEIVHGLWKCIELLDTLSLKDYLVTVKPGEGAGSSVTEAPRGMLYHNYELNRMGIVERADIVTPTAYNFTSLEENLRQLISLNIEKPAEEISLLCEMLVRAYDPCFSCSVH